MNAGEALLLANAAATLFMTGLIWMVQVVHYPAFADTGPEAFPQFHRQHSRRTTWLVFPAMTLELATSAALLWWRPDDVGLVLVWLGLAAAVTVWLLTLVVQIPQHQRLAQGSDEATITALIRLNWWRTAVWTAHSVVAVAMLAVSL